MKRKLTKQEFDTLPEALKEHYKADGDAYALKLEDDDTGALKRAKDYEKAARQAAEAKLRETEKRLADIEAKLAADADKGARAKGDIDALEKSWQAKLAKADADKADALAKMQGQLQRLLVDNVAQTLAADIATVPELILPHIKSRLAVEEADGKHITRVLDAAGNPSALTVDELKAEFIGNEKFSAVIIGSKAKGGGASGGGGGGASDVKKFHNEDGTVNWSKVAQANAKDPTVLDRVKETLPSAQPLVAMP
jgi:hypothetical protein